MSKEGEPGGLSPESIAQLLLGPEIISNPDIRREIKLQLQMWMEAVARTTVAPDFVESMASPLPEKDRAGMEYETIMRMMETTGMISRGTGRIWEGGGYVWLPNGMRLKENVFSRFAAILDDLGYGPFQTPRVLPKAIIEAVNNGIVNLTKGTYWLAEKRDGEFRDSGRYANSTNDPVINYHLGNALRRDPNAVPFKGYGRHQIIRSHSGSTKPFFNSDENTDLFEAYSIQETADDCEGEFELIVATMQGFFRELGVSFLTVDQSMWGNKPVAKKVTSLQAYAAPANGSVRLATMYMHDDTFARVFNVFKKIDGKKEFAHQVGFGFWEGLFIPLLDHLSDKYGLCIPPNFAATQIVLVPTDEASELKARELVKVLGGYRVQIDTRYSKSTQKRLKGHLEAGVPLRVTFDDGGNVSFSRRDTLQNHSLPPAEFAEALPYVLESISQNYSKRSADYVNAHLAEASQRCQIADLVGNNSLVVFDHCGSDECGQEMERNFPGEFLGHVRDFEIGDCCIGCDQKAFKKGLIGRRAPTP